jgi:AcrR family transcriptional regulator
MTTTAKTEKGRQTQATILETAVNIASIEGLEGLTIGRLANELQMSKSGLFGHFGSKEGLQLAALQTARDIFIEEAITPARQSEAGLTRLWVLCDAWLAYLEREVFPGGCLFMTAASEFDNRPGVVRDSVAVNMREWLDYLEYNAQRAINLGHINSDVSSKQLAFEIHSFQLGANWALQLFNERQAPNQARVAILIRLTMLKTAAAPPLPDTGEYL